MAKRYIPKEKILHVVKYEAECRVVRKGPVWLQCISKAERNYRDKVLVNDLTKHLVTNNVFSFKGIHFDLVSDGKYHDVSLLPLPHLDFSDDELVSVIRMADNPYKPREVGALLLEHFSR